MTITSSTSNQVVITQRNVHRWLTLMHDLADVGRAGGHRPYAEFLEQIADSVDACADNDWHDAAGRSIESYAFQWQFTPLPSGRIEFEITLEPVRGADATRSGRRDGSL